MPNWNDIQHFMEAVVPWPGPENPGYVNLHYSLKPKDGGKPLTGMGWPFQKPEDFLSRAAWINNMPNFNDVWFCTSRQRSAGLNTKGKPKAVRLHANAVQLQAIWIDIDVKPGDATGKHYTSIAEAWAAICAFRDKMGLPQFSAVVNSGGGLHVYWISDKPLDPSEWAPYAQGLKAALLEEGVKCDAGLTTDDVRLLRVPGTFNHKYDPPREVALLPIPLRQYDFPNDLSFLTIIPNKPLSCAVLLTSQLFDPKSFASPPAAVFAGLDPTENLGAGIDKYADTKLDPRPIFAQCGFLREAFATGGKDYDNPLWNLSVLCMTFVENGDEYAHAISKGHAGYEPPDTQALYDRKMADRTDRGIGYPQCATIQSNGCSACATCPLLAKGKSPLNIRPEPVVTAAVAGDAPPFVQSQGASDLHLPPNYDVNDAGQICFVKQRQDKEGNELEPVYLRLFYSVLSEPWASHPPRLHCKSTLDVGRVADAMIKLEEISNGPGMLKVLGQQGIKVVIENFSLVAGFLMAWMDILHQRQAASEARPYGWFRDDKGNVDGFVYAGRLYRSDGSEEAAGTPDAKIGKWYAPHGDLQTWYDSCRTITQQDHMELDALIALSFGAPLMDMLGYNSMLLSATGESGAGKSAAFSVGLAVWGHPKLAKDTTTSTAKSTLNKMGQLVSLPFYWDEIKEDKPRAQVYDVAFTATDGTEGSRLTQSIQMQDKGTWNSLMCIASNTSFVDYVINRDPTNTAGINRVFEYYVTKKPPDAPGMISRTLATQQIDKLRHNYGRMGQLYSKYLACNHVAINKMVTDESLHFEQVLTATQEERLWVAMCACLVTGAKLANVLGADFKVDPLREFLVSTYEKMRLLRDGASLRAGSADSVEDILTYYLTYKMGRQQVIWTDIMNHRFGRPKSAVVIAGPKPGQVIDGVQVRFSRDTNEVAISRKDFFAYLVANKYATTTTERGLVAAYGAIIKKINLCGGTSHESGRSPCIILPIAAGSGLEYMLLSHSPAGDAGAAEPQEVETGIGETNGRPTDPQSAAA